MSSGSFELFRIHGDLPSTAGDHLSTLLRHVVAGAFTRPTAQIHLSYVHMAERQEAIFLIATTSDVAPALAMLIAEMAITALAKACRECGVPIRQMGYPTHRPRSPRGLASYHASRAVARFLASATWPTQIRFMTPTAQLAVTVELGRPFGSAATKESVVCSEIITMQQTQLGTLLHIRSGPNRMQLLLSPEIDPSRVRPGCLIESAPILGRVRRRIVGLRPCQSSLPFA